MYAFNDIETYSTVTTAIKQSCIDKRSRDDENVARYEREIFDISAIIFIGHDMCVRLCL